ncbi:pentapeptide repeat-containing protein [Methanolobus sp. WCC5]|uniref:pentapeptide repeat-containing protein n=1 Tax=Methanolobus sp. WCC5 TaxID=3125785 RepID=UPI003248BA6A
MKTNRIKKSIHKKVVDVKKSFPKITRITFVLLILTLLFLSLWYIPKLQIFLLGDSIQDPLELAQLEDKFRSTLAQILGGFVILVGLYLTHKRVLATEQSIIISQEGQITERFTRAIEHLGKDQLEFKLGGIYALERIANESEKDYWPIMEILCAYIRKNAPNAKNNHVISPLTYKDYNGMRMDIEATLGVLTRRNIEHEKNKVPRIFNLSQTFLPKADFCEAYFPKLNLSQSNLVGVDFLLCNLKFANFSATILSKADLSDAIFYGSNFHKAVLIDANLSRSNFSKSNFSQANLSQAILNLTDFSGANLSEANLSGATIEDVDFSKANLSKANFSGAIISAVDFSGLNLSGANFSNAILDDVDFVDTNLSGVDFSGVDLSNIDISTANLSGAILGDKSKNVIKTFNEPC